MSVKHALVALAALHLFYEGFNGRAIMKVSGSDRSLTVHLSDARAV
jgi:hypothetical protein